MMMTANNIEINPELQRLITERLEEHERKLKRLREMEHTRKKREMKRYLSVVAIVASVLSLFVFFPINQSSPLDELNIQPSTMTFRNASPEISEISRLIEGEEYSAAIAKTEKALKASDEKIWLIKDTKELYDDEESLYEEQMEYTNNSELRWMYIYALVKEGREKDAIKQLKLYLKRPQYCHNIEEAKALLKLLKKNN